MKHEYQGITATNQYLTVYFTSDYGAAIRFDEVKVPIDALLDERVTAAVDHMVRIRLRAVWEDDDALPGIG